MVVVVVVVGLKDTASRDRMVVRMVVSLENWAAIVDGGAEGTDIFFGIGGQLPFHPCVPPCPMISISFRLEARHHHYHRHQLNTRGTGMRAQVHMFIVYKSF